MRDDALLGTLLSQKDGDVWVLHDKDFDKYVKPEKIILVRGIQCRAFLMGLFASGQADLDAALAAETH